MIARATVQKVIDTADVMDVVGSFINLKKRGANFLGLCPFHNEKTPSFTVSPAKGIYKCFGCGKAGNAVTFIQDHEKLSFPEAIKWLAKRYQIEVEEKEQSPEEKEQQKEEESIRIINEYAENYFHNILLNDVEGKNIGLSYFKERGFTEKTITTFKLGYSPELRTSFSFEAVDKGYKKELLIKSGLVGEYNGSLADKYSGRVIFPIHNQSGKTIGFGARILKSNSKAPKYINTPENVVYNKSKTLYGIYQAKRTITNKDECFLVEGYTDVISLHQGGVENVVASSGTSLTDGQLYLLKRYTQNLTILYDGDAAGIKAALRGMDMALEIGLNVRLVLLPENHDPDSFIQELGADAFGQYVEENKKDFILFKLEASLQDAKNDSVKKSKLVNEIAETISKINKVEDFTKQQDYIRRCSELLEVEEAGLVAIINKKIRERFGKQRAKDARDSEAQLEAEALEAEAAQYATQDTASLITEKDYMQERALVRVLLQFGNRDFDENISVADFIFNEVSPEDFNNKKWEQIFSLYHGMYKESLQFPELKEFTYHQDSSFSQAVIEAIEVKYEKSSNWFDKHQIEVPSDEETFRGQAEQNVDYFYIRKIKTMFKELHAELGKFKGIESENETEVNILLKSILEIKEQEKNILLKWKIPSIG